MDQRERRELLRATVVSTVPHNCVTDFRHRQHPVLSFVHPVCGPLLAVKVCFHSVKARRALPKPAFSRYESAHDIVCTSDPLVLVSSIAGQTKVLPASSRPSVVHLQVLLLVAYVQS
eukprot:4860773-Amphidinium_carterae.1